jgi:alpha-1,6-mannosyltransferase
MSRLVIVAPWARPDGWLVALAGLQCIVTVTGPALHARFGDWALIAMFGLGSLAAFGASRLGGHTDQRKALVVILIGAVAMRLALLFTEPTLSSDVYRYIWDGRVQAAGINPYAHVPAAPELARLRDPAIWPQINRADYAVTIYPPVAQALFLGITRVGETVVVMKHAMLGFEAVAIAATIALLKRLGLPLASVAAYAWHPLPIWEFAGNGHADAAMIALMMVSLVAFLNGRTLLAGLLATLGALIKPTALLALPVFWRPWNWKLPAVVVATIALAYLPYLSVGTRVLGFVGTYLEEEGFSEGHGFRLLWLLEQLTGPLPSLAGALYAAVAGLVLASLAIAVGFRPDRSERAAIRSLNWLLITFLVLSTPHYPWYFVVLGPFLALAPTATAWTLTTVSVVLYYVVPGPLTPGYEVRFATFTLAMFAAVAYDLWRDRNGASRLVGETT